MQSGSTFTNSSIRGGGNFNVFEDFNREPFVDAPATSVPNKPKGHSSALALTKELEFGPLFAIPPAAKSVSRSHEPYRPQPIVGFPELIVPVPHNDMQSVFFVRNNRTKKEVPVDKAQYSTEELRFLFDLKPCKQATGELIILMEDLLQFDESRVHTSNITFAAHRDIRDNLTWVPMIGEALLYPIIDTQGPFSRAYINT